MRALWNFVGLIALASLVDVVDGFQIVANRAPSRVKGSSATCPGYCPSKLMESSRLHMVPSKDDDEKNPKAKSSSVKITKKKVKKTKKVAKKKARALTPDEKEKELLMKELKSRLKKPKVDLKKDEDKKDKGNLLQNLDPFKAGQNLRKTIDSLSTLGAVGAAGNVLSSEARKKYYLDDRLNSEGGLLFSERNPNVERAEKDEYVPEVLVIGATGEVGRLVVRRLLLEGRFRVRVLVRDLYSKTLNLLGTGVAYCQGDLSNVESLEFALTDVDKIVFCASAPRPDEDDFKEKFNYFLHENLQSRSGGDDSDEDEELEKLDSVLELRAQLAEQVDFIGMGNLVRAYQNVRHADYGTSQAAKRTLFKFSSRSEDFDLFSIDDYDSLADASPEVPVAATEKKTAVGGGTSYDDDMPDEDPYADYYSDDYDEYAEYDDEYGSDVEQRRGASVQVQCKWIRNEFGNAVFVGKVPKVTQAGVGGEAAIISSRLRSRDEPEKGIDLGVGFAGFVVRLVSDGSNFEAFVRTEAYERDGIEYVCKFSTGTKPSKKNNKSRNKFITVRLPFENFKPVKSRLNAVGDDDDDDEISVEDFSGRDIQSIGFRYRSANNEDIFPRRDEGSDSNSFYMALSYMKVYRVQPEPEFIYLSDARIPRKISSGMVRHDMRQLLAKVDESGADGDTIQLLDEKEMRTTVNDKRSRSKEETYFKYRGEEIIKSSGISYTVIRVSGFNENPSGEASTIELYPSNEEEITPVSRDEAAQVCVSALLDPNALNKSFYMTKNQRRNRGGIPNEDISKKFSDLPVDAF